MSWVLSYEQERMLAWVVKGLVVFERTDVRTVVVLVV